MTPGQNPPGSPAEYRCSPWTRAQAVDPVGSAGSFDQLLLVEWPLPWPADVADVPALAEAAADPRARVMIVVPRTDGLADGRRRVVHHRRAGTHRLVGVDHLVAPSDVPGLLRELLDAAPDTEPAGWPTAAGEAPPEVLVCGHGRRDACCGRWGTLLHAELAARHQEVRVWRCSHTGGHRFAPTAITLPDGRAWAYADAELLEGVLSRRGEVGALTAHDRGCLALDPWAQVVERAMFAHVGWAWLDHQVTHVSHEVGTDGLSARVQLSWRAPDGGIGAADADVVVSRRLPVLVCGEPPETALKVSPEYALRRLEMT